ncbi:hypothetical protein EV421DRAFT_1839439 [Armillaria borealis]|uniref:F-box domain-containing protein n=1 Tax=Armillaria borealis TaxID=47425 RepID=A0AA39MI62_9AGAR|nr:hypothetical protein EV421DRAFT_1839439 [Armillaria borealis]
MSSTQTITLQGVDDDVLGVICSILGQYELKQMSVVDKRLREITLPLLLRRVRIHFIYIEDVWQLATEAIESMLASTAFDVVVRHTRFLDIRLSDQSEDPMPSVLPTRLVDFLSAPFRQLHTLLFTIDEKQVQAFDDKFTVAHIELPTVTILIVGAYCDFMVRLCPNVEHVATFGWVWLSSRRGSMTREHSFRLITAAGDAKMLRHFEMNEWWSASLLHAVYDAMPSIQKLTLKDGGPLRDSLQVLVPILSQFKKLKKLGLVDPTSLHVGFNPPTCGNVYMGPNGGEIRKKVQAQVEAARNHIADTVFGACISLEVLILGNRSKAIATRCPWGKIREIQWCVEEHTEIVKPSVYVAL